MKRFISIVISLILCTTAVFAQDTYEDDDDVYDALQEALLSMYQNYGTLKDKKLLQKHFSK